MANTSEDGLVEKNFQYLRPTLTVSHIKQGKHLQSYSQLPEFTVKGPEEVQV